jgi:alcohol dehydrogenase
MWKPQGIYSKFILKQPTLFFGLNSIYGLKNYPCSKVAVIHGSALKDDYKDIIKRSISAFQVDFIIKSWLGEPSSDELSPVIKELDSLSPDLIIAVGGGSVIDGVKLARTLYEFPSFDLSYPNFSLLEWKSKFIAMPTTLGSGTEISSATVLYNKDKKTKEMIVNHDLIPDVVILDPQFIINSNYKLIMASITDATSHIIEGYVSNVDNGIANVYAEKGLQIINDLSNRTISELNNEDVNRLQLAGYFGGIVQNHSIVGAAHAIAHQLSSYGFSHAVSIAICLPTVIKLNCQIKEIQNKYITLAKNARIRNGINGLIDLLLAIRKNMGIEEEMQRFFSLRNQMIQNKEFIENAESDAGGKGNPIPITSEFVKKILKEIS